MNRIFCSTGALIGRANGRNPYLLTECAERLNCDGFEFLMYDDWYEKSDEIASYINTLSKPFPVFHIEKNVGDLISRNELGDTEKALDLFCKNCEFAKKIKSDKLVLHLWSGLDSDKNIQHNIDVYKVVREIASNFELQLTIENVVCNKSDPMNHLMCLFKLFPDIHFTFDTKMSEFHNQTELLYLEENLEVYERISHIHINDYKGGYKEWQCLKTLQIGDGQVDFARFFNFLNQKMYSGDFTIESTSFDHNGVIDFKRLNESIERVRGLLGQC